VDMIRKNSRYSKSYRIRRIRENQPTRPVKVRRFQKQCQGYAIQYPIIQLTIRDRLLAAFRQCVWHRTLVTDDIFSNAKQ